MRVQARLGTVLALRAALGLALAGGASACGAGSQVTRGEVDALRQRVVELEAERRRQRTRLDEVTARLVTLEGRSTRPGRSRPDLPVVRVRPTESRRRDGAEPEAEEEVSEAYAASLAGGGDAPSDDDGERPVLRLYESESLPAPRAERRSGSRSIELAAVTERLPVVPMPEGTGPGIPLPEPPPLEAEPPVPQPSVDDVVREARRQVGAGDCGGALESLAQVVASSPEHALADDAMLLRAQCFRRQGAHLRAIGELERMARRYPSSDRAADGLLLTAESYAAIGDQERAREIFGQVMRRFPRSSAASRATARVQELSRGSSARETP